MASQLMMQKVYIHGAVAADVITVYAATTPANHALTVVAQPPHARKLAFGIVVGTSTTTAITAGSIAISGLDQDGFQCDEVVSLIANASDATRKSAHAYAHVTSMTLSGYVASGSGTGNTVSVGVAPDFGLPSCTNSRDLKVTKVTKIVMGTAAGTVVASDDAVAATVDATARTYAPTTAPDAIGFTDFEITYAFDAQWMYD